MRLAGYAGVRLAGCAGVRLAGCSGGGLCSGCALKVFTETWEPGMSQLGFHPSEPFCCCAQGLGGADAEGDGVGRGVWLWRSCPSLVSVLG